MTPLRAWAGVNFVLIGCQSGLPSLWSAVQQRTGEKVSQT